jgi:hypothetical protein
VTAGVAEAGCTTPDRSLEVLELATRALGDNPVAFRGELHGVRARARNNEALPLTIVRDVLSAAFPRIASSAYGAQSAERTVIEGVVADARHWLATLDRHHAPGRVADFPSAVAGLATRMLLSCNGNAWSS